jgi:hypothetical protein
MTITSLDHPAQVLLTDKGIITIKLHITDLTRGRKVAATRLRTGAAVIRPRTSIKCPHQLIDRAVITTVAAIKGIATILNLAHQTIAVVKGSQVANTNQMTKKTPECRHHLDIIIITILVISINFMYFTLIFY